MMRVDHFFNESDTFLIAKKNHENAPITSLVFLFLFLTSSLLMASDPAGR